MESELQSPTLRQPLARGEHRKKEGGSQGVWPLLDPNRDPIGLIVIPEKRRLELPLGSRLRFRITPCFEPANLFSEEGRDPMLDQIHLPRIDAEGFDHFFDGPSLARVAIE